MTETKQGYKKTKLGWIPDDWDICSIGKFGKIITGSTPSTKNKENYGDEYPFISPADIQYNKYINDTRKKLSEQGYKLSRSISQGAILFVCIGSTIGKVGIASEDSATNQQINSIEVNRQNHNEYVFYELLSNSSRIKRYAGEQAVPIINKSAFSKFLIRKPPIPEQKKIAQILSTWDKAIEKTNQLIEQKKLLKKGLMERLLTGKVRFEEFEDEEWEATEFRNIITRIKRKNKQGNDNVVTISAQRGFVKQENFFKKRVASKTLNNYYLVKRGEFAYNKSYSKGYPMGAFKRLDDFDYGVVTTLYICFAINEGHNSDFFLHFFEAGMMVRGLSKIAQEGGRAHGLLNIRISDFMKLKLTIPSLKEQQKIASVLNLFEKDILKHESYLEDLQQQKRGLMQQLLTGATRLKV